MCLQQRIRRRGLQVSGDKKCSVDTLLTIHTFYSQRECIHECFHRGACFNGTCICTRRWAGEDCSVDVGDLRKQEVLDAVSGKIGKEGKFDSTIEHVVHSRMARKYASIMCKTKACQNTWIQQMQNILSVLPRDDYIGRFQSCALVSSGKGIVYNATSQYKEFRKYGRGVEIDRHKMVFRLNNAPTEKFRKWVGSRTTHRFVEGDYARLVQNMMGTEIIVNQTNSIVTPTTWWNGGYPAVEKITYIMAVEPLKSRSQFRAPENNGYMPFTEIFPGSRHYLLSPVFMNEVASLYLQFRDSIKHYALGCYKAKEPRVPLIFLALMYTLQTCSKVHLYGLALDVHAKAKRRLRVDKKYRIRTRESPSEPCCYYPKEYDFSSHNPLCDELTRTFVIPYLMDTGRIRIHS